MSSNTKMPNKICSRWVNCTIEIIGDNGEEWGEVYENFTGLGVLGNVVEDRADFGICK